MNSADYEFCLYNPKKDYSNKMIIIWFQDHGCNLTSMLLVSTKQRTKCMIYIFLEVTEALIDIRKIYQRTVLVLYLSLPLNEILFSCDSYPISLGKLEEPQRKCSLSSDYYVNFRL